MISKLWLKPSTVLNFLDVIRLPFQNKFVLPLKITLICSFSSTMGKELLIVATLPLSHYFIIAMKYLLFRYIF